MDTSSSQEEGETNARSPSPRSIKLHNEQPRSIKLARPEPLKANIFSNLSAPSESRAVSNLGTLFPGVNASPAISASSSVSGNSENPSPATTPVPSGTDESPQGSSEASSTNMMRRGSKVTRVM